MIRRELTEREREERERLRGRLKGRKPLTREEWEEAGIPHLDERSGEEA